jgi:hypothetical protein
LSSPCAELLFYEVRPWATITLLCNGVRECPWWPGENYAFLLGVVFRGAANLSHPFYLSACRYL